MAVRNTPSKGGKPDKIMRDALSVDLHREDEVDGKKIKRFRRVAHAWVEKAIAGDMAAIREINDRMDGKVPQAVVGGDDGSDPIRFADVTDEQRVKAALALLAKAAGKTERP